ncbi:uncharacterized protein [Palaemon carinicauda]|uniref:uncharacterized protein n=1 Tax=Palaemon carinicauda TaxID=392227 RepID=UPI0035B5E834
MISRQKCEVRMLWLATLCVLTVLGEAVSAPYYGGRPSGFLQVIRRLGVNRSGALTVSQGRSQSGESPIYFIRLPPTPYFYLENAVSALGDPDHKVPVDFTNNGRPKQVYHWNLPELNSHSAQPLYQSSIPSALPSPAGVVPPASARAPLPAGVVPPASARAPLPAGVQGVPVLLSGGPQLKPSSQTQIQLLPAPVSSPADKYRIPISPSTAQPSGSLGKKTWISGRKQYSYNGRPSGIYIYKSKRPIRPITVPKTSRRPTKKASQRK